VVFGAVVWIGIITLGYDRGWVDKTDLGEPLGVLPQSLTADVTQGLRKVLDL